MFTGFASSSSGSSSSAASASSNQQRTVRMLQAMQKQFLGGAAGCDVIVRVSYSTSDDSTQEAHASTPATHATDDRPAGQSRNAQKRAKKRGQQQQQQAPPPPPPSQQHQQQAAPPTIDIPCHSWILMNNSSYFAASLDGAFLESQKKMVELELADEQAVSDLKLLFKLSYTDSYMRDGDEPLDVHTRMRLAFLANALEFRECVDEVLSSFLKVSVEESLTCLEDLPEELQNHGFMTSLMNKMIEKLAKETMDNAQVVRSLGKIIDRVAREVTKDKTEEDRKGDMLHKAGNALAKALGPVRNLFEERQDGKGHSYSDDDDFYKHLSLKAHVRELSLDAVAAFLEKSDLDIRVENEAYYLMCAWIYQCPHLKGSDSKEEGASGEDDSEEEDPEVAAFEKLAVHIRFQHITTDFLANIVANCPLATYSDLLPWIMRCSLLARNTNPDLARASNISLGRFNRGVGGYEWNVWTCFGLEELLPLKQGGEIIKYICIARGYPIALKISRGGPKDTLGIYFYVAGLRHEDANEKGCPRQHAIFNISIQKFPSAQVFHLHKAFTGNWEGTSDFFSKPWKEVVHQKSSSFCEKGRLAFKITFDAPVKK